MKLHSLSRLAGAALMALAFGQPGNLTASGECTFQVESPDGQLFTERQLAGKVTVLFYETREGTNHNRAAKDELNRFYSEQSPALVARVQRVGVVNAAGTPAIFRPFWRSGLRSAAAREGITVYADWDGQMGARCGLADPSGTSLALFDHRAQKRAVYRGDLTEIETIKTLLVQMVVAAGAPQPTSPR
ncbi:MAG: hypothetical protein K1X75_07200 [Leptospirales bacterium]|nr:hypothetical protein [Leptospirales bacterium]